MAGTPITKYVTVTNLLALVTIDIGDAVVGGGANRVLYEDASQLLAASANFTFNGTNLLVGVPSYTAARLNVQPVTSIAGSAAAFRAGISGQDGTVTFTGGTGQTGDFYSYVFQGHTVTSATAGTITNAATIYVSSAPAAAGSITITNPYALWVDSGVTRFDGNTLIGTGSQPDLLLHVRQGGTTPSDTAGYAGTAAVFQNSANTGDSVRVNILSGETGVSYLQFGKPSDPDNGAISYDNSTGNYRFRAAGASDKFSINGDGNVFARAGVTGMNEGFIFIAAAAGAPTGAPSNPTGTVPLYFDTTNNKIYVYDGGWLSTAALT